MQLPQRTSLATEAAKVIIKMIESGEIKKQLPGERTMAERLQIGRDTLRGALKQLESTGWISGSQHGKRRKILKQVIRQADDQKATKRIGMLSPKRIEDMPPTMLTELDNLRDMLSKRGYTLDVHSPGIFHMQRPEARLKAFMEESPCDAWVLYQTSKPIQEYFQKHNIPCIVRGYPHANVQLPHLDGDWRAATIHAASILTRSGHKSIGIVVPDAELEGLKVAQDGLRSVIEGPNINGTLHVIQECRSASSVIDAFQASLREPIPPTALVVTRSRHVLTLLSWLASAGIRIPRDISLIALTHEYWFEHLYPAISHYYLPPANMARSIMRQLLYFVEQGANEASGHLIIPEFKSGSSVKQIEPTA